MLRKVHSKQVWHPPSASDYNAMAMAAESYLAGPDGRPVRQRPIDLCIVAVKNSSGADRRQGDVLQLSSSLLTTLDASHLWLDGVAPVAPLWTSMQGVLRQATPSGTIGPLQVSGVCLAFVNVTDATHQFCDAAAATYVLQSAYSGPFQIQHKPSGTGEKWCVVLLGPKRPGAGVAKLGGTLAAGSPSAITTATATLQKRSSNAFASAGQTITVCHWFARAFATNDYLGVQQHDDGEWYSVAAECA